MIENTLHSPNSIGAIAQDNLTILLNLDNSCLGKPSSLVKNAIRHLCGFQKGEKEQENASFENFDILAREYYEKIKKFDSSGTQLAIFLLLLSSYFHELRHAHDLMSTTFGQDYLFKVLNCYQNSFAMLSELKSWQDVDDNRRIPLPFKENFSQCKGISSEILRLINKYNQACSDIKNYQDQQISHFSATPIRLLETMAVDIQLDFIHDLFGDEALSVLIKIIQNNSESSKYLRIRNDLRDAFYEAGFREDKLGSIINYISWTSLMLTNQYKQEPYECLNSATYFDGLVDYILRETKVKSLKETIESVNDFCQKWNLYNPNEMQQIVVKYLNKRKAKFKEASLSIPKDDFRSSIQNTYFSFIDAFDAINTVISKSQEAYFGQRLYCWTFLAGLLPSIHIKLLDDGIIYNCMSTGKIVIDYNNWSKTTIMSTSFKLILEGKPTQESFYDRIIMDSMSHDMGLKFVDRGELFQF